MARPTLKIDPLQVEKMAQLGNTIEDIAWILGCSRDTIERRYAANVQKGKALRRSILRDKMWDLAINHSNVTMCIWLSKQDLGMTDKVEEKVGAEISANIVYESSWGSSAETKEDT